MGLRWRSTPSVDTETELLIQDVDRIVVLHKGTVREMGTHQELLALKGIYSRLYQLQYQGAAREHDRMRAGAPGPT